MHSYQRQTVLGDFELTPPSDFENLFADENFDSVIQKVDQLMKGTTNHIMVPIFSGKSSVQLCILQTISIDSIP